MKNIMNIVYKLIDYMNYGEKWWLLFTNANSWKKVANLVSKISIIALKYNLEYWKTTNELDVHKIR